MQRISHSVLCSLRNLACVIPFKWSLVCKCVERSHCQDKWDYRVDFLPHNPSNVGIVANMLLLFCMLPTYFKNINSNTVHFGSWALSVMYWPSKETALQFHVRLKCIFAKLVCHRMGLVSFSRFLNYDLHITFILICSWIICESVLMCIRKALSRICLGLWIPLAGSSSHTASPLQSTAANQQG